MRVRVDASKPGQVTIDVDGKTWPVFWPDGSPLMTSELTHGRRWNFSPMANYPGYVVDERNRKERREGQKRYDAWKKEHGN